MIVVDTNVWSETVRPFPNAAVVSWVVARSAEIAITSITIGELVYGVALMAEGRRKQALASQIDRLIASAAGRTLSYGPEAAYELARIKFARKRLGMEIVVPEDAMIAAIAAAHNCSVATRNVDDFRGMGIEVINPWMGADYRGGT